MFPTKCAAVLFVIFLFESTSYSQDIDGLDEGEGNMTKRAVTSDGFSVYWQVPTDACHVYGMDFTEVGKYGIIQNSGDRFKGDKIVILYDPGSFPTLSPFVNGGLPQKGDLEYHLNLFEGDVDKALPNRNFDGLAVIDFEHWRPIFRENWSKLDVYREKSRELVQQQHPFWSEKRINTEAERQWEEAAFLFFRKTLDKARKLRPNARWGYYGFPYCFNYAPNNPATECTDKVRDDNNRSGWMWKAGNAVYPSAYFSEKELTEAKRARMIQGRVEEGLRIASKANIPVYIYTRFKYQDTLNFVTETDMWSNLNVPKKYGANGVIIWGATKDVNTQEKCANLLDYLNNVIGPAMRKINNRNFDAQVETNDV